MKSICILFTFFYSILFFGQTKIEYSSVDMQIAKIPTSATYSTSAIANYIQSKFITQEDKIRAVFYWTATTISYDIANRYTLEQGKTLDERVKKTLKTRKGVCQNYAEVFNEIANKLTIKTVIIVGYTKQNGVLDAIPHAWCASKINNKWFLFDPTWASGYVEQGQFKKQVNFTYFKVRPDKMILSHMPYDYLWQLLPYTITNKEFTSGKTDAISTKNYFDFEKELATQDSLIEEDKLNFSSKRIIENGVTNSMIKEMLSFNDSKIRYLREIKALDNLNSIVKMYKEAVTELNQFIAYRNKQFKPVKSDVMLRSMVLNPYNKIVHCQELLETIGELNAENSASVKGLKNSLNGALQLTIKHKNFVFAYFTKSQKSREKMFYSMVY